MTKEENKSDPRNGKSMTRRKALTLAASTTLVAAATSNLGALALAASEPPTAKETTMKHKAYVYTELQNSVSSFDDIPWHRVNQTIKEQPGFINKTWLFGVGNHSGGGLYTFDSIENAQKFVTGYFPSEARGFGVAQTTRVFDADATEEASRDMNSMHYDGKIDREPGAYVYTEVQLHAVPFDSAAPWRDLNPTLKKQPGLLAKTWLSGLHAGTPGGLYAFDTIENAKKFALDYFPTEAAALNAAFYTRVFDAVATKAASVEMDSPFYS